MIRKWIVPGFALCGVVFAVITVIRANRPTPAAPAVTEPNAPPFPSYVAGAGIVEARSENIGLGTVVAGVVENIYAKVGDNVKTGDPLWLIDDRDLRADLHVKEAALLQQTAQLQKMQQGTRPEEIPAAEALVQADQVALDDAKTQLERYEAASGMHAVSDDDITHRRYAMQSAAAHLAQSQANLALMKAGTWQEDLSIAAANVAAAQADVDHARLLLDRLTVKAPMDGQILQVNIHLGEYATAGALSTPLMLMGNVDQLVVRTDIDENDASRFDAHSAAKAFLRGNPNISFPLTFYRIEPYVIPKKSLTGDTTERVDTRVLQALYTFEKGTLPVYVGQQMDVFIEAPPLDQLSATSRPSVLGQPK